MYRAVLIALMGASLVGCDQSEPDVAVDEPAALPRVVPLTTSSAEARQAFEQAEQLRMGVQPDRARPLYEQAVARDPAFAQAHLGLAWSVGAEQRDVHLARAKELAAGLSELERRWTFAQAARISRAPDALALTSALGEEAAGDWFVQMAIGQMAHEQGELDTARVAFAMALKLAPEAAPPYNSLAYVFAAEGDYDRAVKTIVRYAELAPGHPNPQDSKGEILLMAGQLEQAEQAFRTALALDPSFRADDGLAVVQLHRGDLAGGIETLQRALHKGPDKMRLSVSHSLFLAYLAAGRDADAEKLSGETSALSAAQGHLLPELDGQVLRARLLLERERWAEASALLDAALQTAQASPDPTAPWLARKLRLARLQAALGSGELASADALGTEIVAMEPGDDLAHFAGLLMAHHRRDLPAALAELEALHDPLLVAEGRLRVAELLAAAGETARATELRQQVARTYSRDPHTVLLRQKAERALES
jgi:tetratricopeptide (TPR) repeat protein